MVHLANRFGCYFAFKEYIFVLFNHTDQVLSRVEARLLIDQALVGIETKLLPWPLKLDHASLYIPKRLCIIINYLFKGVKK